jgi:hypothetical protein
MILVTKPMYEYGSLREFAALSNVPILYCLAYQTQTHQIAGQWAYEWLINFVETSDLVVFHPKALELVKEYMPHWKDPYKTKNDYQLFLEGIFPDPLEGERMIIDAIKQNKLLYKEKTTGKWETR